jgi:hypothetical protein
MDTSNGDRRQATAVRPAEERQKRRLFAPDNFVVQSGPFVEVRQKRIRLLKRVARVQIIAT